MISQIPGGAKALDKLVCDSKTLRGSAMETEDGEHQFIAQATVDACALGVADVTPENQTTVNESSQRTVNTAAWAAM